MSSLEQDIKSLRRQSIPHTLIKIDAYSNSDGFLYVFSNDEKSIGDDDKRIYFSSSTQFGEWVKRLNFKINDKIYIKVNQGGEAEYAEAVD